MLLYEYVNKVRILLAAVIKYSNREFILDSTVMNL